MELTEQLETERHQNKELIEKLQTTEANLAKLADAIEIKDRELTEMRNDSHDVNDKSLIQFNQLEDRLRHYEAQENSYHVLENELKEAKKLMELLKLENAELKELINKNHENKNSPINDQVSMENHQLNENEDHQIKNYDNHFKKRDIHQENNNEIIDTMNKDLAMKRLEEKFMKTMADIANLQDEKQSLEHLVLQLQGETETIGEYIMLYQHQRAVLKQRAIEKEEQLKRLASDREEMRNKLEKLNHLIERLMSEKSNGIPVDILEQRQKIITNENLCVEHSKIQNEMQKENVEQATKNTAEKIIELLSEIKTSSLVQEDENFHPCPWCSGQLINV